MPTTINDLLKEIGILKSGKVSWDTKVSEKGEGIYVVSLSDKVDANNSISQFPIFNESIILKWINNLPEFRLDGAKPTTQSIVKRLSEFWLPDECILYIGKAPLRRSGSGISKRVDEYYRTEIGKGSPHSGGQWIKVLENLKFTTVHYARCDNPENVERLMLELFMKNVSSGALRNLRDKELPLPFANLRYKPYRDKNHGLTDQRF